MNIIEKIEQTKIDWSDFIAASKQTTDLINEICSSKENIKLLLDNMLSSKKLRAMCESHQLLDVLVLYDAIESQGFRIRMHIATESHLQRPHDHRFSFTTKILSGGYEHVIYNTAKSPYEVSNISTAKNHQNKLNPDPNCNFGNCNFNFAFKKFMQPETTMTISHDVIHTVMMEKGACSIIIRSPAVKERSFIYDFNEQKLWWRFGIENETTQRREEKVMSSQKLTQVIESISQQQLI